jgi:sugar lactone lactonase YvrE
MNRHFALTAFVASWLMVGAGAFVVRAAQQPSGPLPPGTIITVAGTGNTGFSGDGGLATGATVWNPLDQAVDAAGNLFIADQGNNRIRKVTPDGTITTVAGNGKFGLSKDGGPAIQASFDHVAGVSVDAAGNLFVADAASSHRIRMVSPSGIITTASGGGRPADGVGDGGPATAASLKQPNQTAVDPVGNLFIADWASRRIRKVDAAGTITTVAGGGQPPDGRGDGGLATVAHFSYPLGVAVARAGGVYVADFVDNRVRKVGADGKITTVAGGGQPADGLGDGGPATEARLDGPSYITVDPGGNLFIAENRGERIRKVSPAGMITTVAGTGQTGHTGDGGPATAAQLNSPESVSVDRAGNLFFTEGPRFRADRVSVEAKGNNLVREVIGVATPQ